MNNLNKYYIPKTSGWGVITVIFTILIFLILYTNSSNSITHDNFFLSAIYTPLIYIFLVSIYYFYVFTFSLKHIVFVTSILLFPLTVTFLPLMLAFSSRNEYHFHSRIYLAIGLFISIGNLYTSLT